MKIRVQRKKRLTENTETLKSGTPTSKLAVFDFDLTLAITHELVIVRDKNTNKIVDHLHTQQEQDEYEIDEANHYFDYSEYDTVSDDAEPIDKTVAQMERFIDDDTYKVVIVTARQQIVEPSIRDFMRGIGVDMSDVDVYGTNGSENKPEYLRRIIKENGISEYVIVFEDTLRNIQLMLPLENEYAEMTFEFVHVVTPESDTEIEEARKFSYPKGEYSTEPYQRMLKRVHPAMKRRLTGLGGNNYLVKGKKKMKDFKRSKSSPPSG